MYIKALNQSSKCNIPFYNVTLKENTIYIPWCDSGNVSIFSSDDFISGQMPTVTCVFSPVFR